jgi:hypothetical protein
VFDGKAPALKRRTLELRRKQRNTMDEDDLFYKKAAQKLLDSVILAQIEAKFEKKDRYSRDSESSKKSSSVEVEILELDNSAEISRGLVV